MHYLEHLLIKSLWIIWCHGWIRFKLQPSLLSELLENYCYKIHEYLLIIFDSSLSVMIFDDLLSCGLLGVPQSRSSSKDGYTRGVYPHDQRHHAGHSQGSGRWKLMSPGGHHRYSQPEQKSHRRNAAFLQGDSLTALAHIILSLKFLYSFFYSKYYFNLSSCSKLLITLK